ncbi:MAG: hypothetical protein HKN47_28710 [Pirellulaceae bacterium]|nr:hypothetical protein [Pirellulaceae bacterium]
MDATNLAAQRLQNQDVDPRLSRADVDRLPLGAWSFDSYGNPIDRMSRVLDRHGNPVSQQRTYELTIGRNNPAFQNTSAIPTGSPVPNPGGMIVGSPAMTPGNGFGQVPPGSNLSNREPISSSDSLQSKFDSRGRELQPGGTKRQTLAAQPLFNGLLLMSIVANIYLIFWLKNLRHQFHDLVSSKRLSGSSSVTA